jgi:hypothetical protein
MASPGMTGESSDVTDLRRLGACIIEFLSNHATDPHLYFDLKMGRELEAARSPGELTDLADRLLHWVTSLDLSQTQLARLEAGLAACGLPDFSKICAAGNDKLCQVLASGHDSS